MKLHELDLTKKIRRKNWIGITEFIMWDKYQNNFLKFNMGNKHTGKFIIGPNCIQADDWEYFDEPKKKKIVKMWPAVVMYKSVSGNVYDITNRLFSCEERAINTLDNRFVKLATEYPAIEVEVE